MISAEGTTQRLTPSLRRVIEGEVEMDSNHALEDYEVAAGYVLSCQSYPVSDKVVLDFDQL